MKKETVLKLVGVSCIVIGSTALFLSGSGETMVATLVGGVFILAAIVAAFFK